MGVFKERRRAPRELAGLHGMYLIARRSDLGWHDCYLVDASEYGAGTRFRGPSPDVGDDVIIQFDAPGTNGSIRLQATVRHVRADFFGATRGGVEFMGLDETRRERLRDLFRGAHV